MLRPMIAAASAALGLLAALPASAECTFKVLPMPVTMIGMRPTVPVEIGGKERHFLIDSGSFLNALNVKLTTEPGAALRNQGTNSLIGADGKTIVMPKVSLLELEFLGTTFHNATFAVSGRLGSVDGLLGQPMLGRMDVEYDLRGGVIRLVKTDGCRGTDMVYWAKPGQAYSRMAMAWSDRGDTHTTGIVFVNGQRMRATFDTGAPSSFITEAAAARAGVKVTDPNVVSIGKGGGLDDDFDAWVGTFAEVKVGDETISNAPLEIGRSKARDFDLLLGADFFASHHVYVSNNQSLIFFAYDGGPVFRPPQPPPKTPAPSRPSGGAQASQTQPAP